MKYKSGRKTLQSISKGSHEVTSPWALSYEKAAKEISCVKAGVCDFPRPCWCLGVWNCTLGKKRRGSALPDDPCFSQPVTCATRRIPGAFFGLPSLNETQQQQEVEAFSQVSGSTGNKQVQRWKTARIQTRGERSGSRWGIFNTPGVFLVHLM